MPTRPISSHTSSREILMIVIMTAVYYLGTGIISMPRVMLINQRIAHDARNPNSQSSFVDSTSAMLSTLTTVLFSKYFSALGDHVGRRPVLIISALFSLVSNIIWLSASTPLGFYVASMVSGIADIFFYVGISWICDLAPEKSQRGKATGLYVGTVAGLTLSLAVPIGAVLSSRGKITGAYKVSILLYLLVLFMLIVLPVNDTLGIIPKYEPVSDPPSSLPLDHSPLSPPTHNPSPSQPSFAALHHRHLPSDWNRFFIDHLPLSWKSIQLLFREATHPLDWIGNLLVHSSLKTLRLIIVQYFFVVCEFGPLTVGACSVVAGFISFVTLPSFLSRYTPESLVGLTVLGSSVGFILLSAAGTLVHQSLARILSITGLLILAFSASWHPSFQTIITSQYPSHIMGSVSGTLAMITEFGYFPGYGISVLFSLSLSHRSATKHLWPGCSFLICALLCWAAIGLHVYSRGWKTLCLTKLNQVHPTEVKISAALVAVLVGEEHNNTATPAPRLSSELRSVVDFDCAAVAPPPLFIEEIP